MKNFIFTSIAALLISSSSALAADCTDFTGTFRMANTTEPTLTVTQQKCESVTFSYFYTSSGETLEKTYPLDNVRRQTYEDQNLIVYETSGLKDNALVNLVEDFEKATAKTETANSTSTIDSSGNLDNKSEYYDVNGTLYQTQDDYYVRVSK